MGTAGHQARRAPLAGISVLLVPHQGAVVAQALRAVPPVPAAPTEVLEAHLHGERETALGVSRCLCVLASGASWGLRGARREGLRNLEPLTQA